MNKLNIVGNARFDVEPDTATLAINIEQRDFEYSTCATTLNRRAEVARQVLEQGGVDAESIRSNDYRVEKMTAYARERFPAARFVGSHELRVKMPLVREKINRLLFNLTASDAELTVSLGYEVRDLAAYRDKAEALAVADALRRSKIIAEAAGCRILGILAISTGALLREEHTEDGWDINLPAPSDSASASECSSSPGVTPRQLSVSASISMSLEIAALTS